MTSNPSSSSPLPAGNSIPHRPPLSFGAVFCWLALQMLALAAAAFRVPFSARFPALGEQLAMQEMLVVQMIGSALLFPALFRTLASAAIVIGATPLLMMMAGVLAAAEAETMLAICAYALLWMLGLAFWSTVLRTERARMYGVATAAALVIGGATLAYVAREFGPPGEAFDWAGHGYLGPLTGGVTLLETGVRTWSPWVFVCTFAISGLIAAATWHFVALQRSRQFIH